LEKEDTAKRINLCNICYIRVAELLYDIWVLPDPGAQQSRRSGYGEEKIDRKGSVLEGTEMVTSCKRFKRSELEGRSLIIGSLRRARMAIIPVKLVQD
jgi:hypothetical protein